MKKIIIAVFICSLGLLPLSEVFAKGGGGRGGGGARASASRPISKPVSKPVTTQTNTTNAGATKPDTAQVPKKTQVVKPATKVSDKPVVSNTGKKMSNKGKVVDENYKPSFRGGYVPPVGSTVYYQQRSFLDYLPWVFLFTMTPNREVVVQASEPDGTVKEETHQEEGTDTMYVINWIVSILLLGGLIVIIMRLISRKKG